jgi:hypothetical protein
MWAEDNFFIYGKTCYFLQWQHFSNPMISKGVSNEKAWDIRDTITKADSNQKCDNRSKVSGLDEIYVCSCPPAGLIRNVFPPLAHQELKPPPSHKICTECFRQALVGTSPYKGHVQFISMGTDLLIGGPGVLQSFGAL